MLHFWWCFSGKLWPKVPEQHPKKVAAKGSREGGEWVWRHAIKDGHHLREGPSQCCGQPDLQPCAVEWEIEVPCWGVLRGGPAAQVLAVARLCQGLEVKSV